MMQVELRGTGRFLPPATLWTKNCMIPDTLSHSSYRMLFFCRKIQNGGSKIKIFLDPTKAALNSPWGITSTHLFFLIDRTSTRPYPEDLFGNLERWN